MPICHDYSTAEVLALLEAPLFELVDRARTLHLRFHAPYEMELCALVNIKQGGCSEDCGYCSQSSRHGGRPGEPMLKVEEVLAAAREAKARGASRLCMGAAWPKPREGRSFDSVLDMVRAVKREGLETCVTLGLLTLDQARALKAAGLDVYNHNLDTSREYYPAVRTSAAPSTGCR
ncbi:radical SAM protein [Myxococcota bacterium]